MENHFDVIMQGDDIGQTNMEQVKFENENERDKSLGWKTVLIQGITTIISVSNGY